MPSLTIPLPYRFNGENVHSLTNVVSVEPNVHEAFDWLMLYFKAKVLLRIF